MGGVQQLDEVGRHTQPAWRWDNFPNQEQVVYFLGSLTREQSAAAKVVFDSQEGLHYPYTVFYPED
jgi:hypothetical protein